METQMHVELKLPDHVRSAAYVVNHHYIKLTDWNGNELILNPTSMVKYECSDCDHFFFASWNAGKACCPFCGGNCDPKWGTMQLCFVPDDESKFQPPIKVLPPSTTDEEDKKE